MRLNLWLISTKLTKMHYKALTRGHTDYFTITQQIQKTLAAIYGHPME